MKIKSLLMIIALFCLVSNAFSQGGTDLAEHLNHQNDILGTSFNLSWHSVALYVSFLLVVFLTAIMEKPSFSVYIIVILVPIMIVYFCTGNIILFAIAVFLGNKFGKGYFKCK